MPIKTVASRKKVHLAALAVLDGREGQHHRDRRADQDERVDGRQIDGQRIGQLVVGHGPFVRLRAARSSASAPAVLSWAISASAFSGVSPLTSAVRGGLDDHVLGLLPRSGRPSVWRMCSTSACVGRPADLSKMPWVFSSPLSGVRRGVEIAVSRVRAAGAEHDVRADQPGEEHHFRGQEQPHGDLAGRDGRVVVGRGRGRGHARRARVAVELWVATAIVISTLGADKRDTTAAPRASSSRRHRVEQQQEQDRGQVEERRTQAAGGPRGRWPPARTGRPRPDRSGPGSGRRRSRAGRPDRSSPARARRGPGPVRTRRPGSPSSCPGIVPPVSMRKPARW